MNKISIVTSLYRSADYIDEFYARHLACIRQMNLNYEFVFVDDGYPDGAIIKVKELIKKDDNVKLVIFSRNFGQYPAMFAGMANSEGDFIYTTDSDLEESPENILLLYDAVRQDPEVDFVYGVVNERKGGIIRAIFGGVFYKAIRWSTDIDIPKNISWQILMTKRYVESLLLYNEVETLPAGLMVLTGYKQVPIPIEKSYKGSTTYTFKKRLKLALNSVTAFSSKPLIFIGLLGLGITFISFIGILVAIIIKLFFINYQSGWISIVLSIWMTGGLILSSVGITGIYIAKIFNQVKGRPLYIIKSIINSENL
jgi:putative glycosyltransferase